MTMITILTIESSLLLSLMGQFHKLESKTVKYVLHGSRFFPLLSSCLVSIVIFAEETGHRQKRTQNIQSHSMPVQPLVHCRTSFIVFNLWISGYKSSIKVDKANWKRRRNLSMTVGLRTVCSHMFDWLFYAWGLRMFKSWRSTLSWTLIYKTSLIN